MESLAEYRASVAVWQYCPPVLFAFGMFGNSMTVVIIRKMQMKRSAMPVYLTALALSDTCQLLTGLLRGWLIHVAQLDVRTLHVAACKLHTWLVYSSIITSAWLLTFMTMERTASVCKPHTVALLCSRGKAAIVILAVVAASLLVNCHLLVWMDVVEDDNGTSSACSSRDQDYLLFFGSVWSWVDLTLSSLFPFILVLLGNVVIVWKVSVSVRMAKNLCSSRPQDVSHRRKKTSSMTVTLMALSAVFLITTAPICVYNIIESYVEDDLVDDLRGRARLLLSWAVVNMLMYTNSTVNFYLYCLSGARFRRELKRCLCCLASPLPSSSKNGEGATVSNQCQPPTPAENGEVATVSNQCQPPTPAVQSPLALMTIRAPSSSGNGPRSLWRQSRSQRRLSQAFKKRGAKRETNHCVLLSVQAYDQSYFSCSDF